MRATAKSATASALRPHQTPGAPHGAPPAEASGFAFSTAGEFCNSRNATDIEGTVYVAPWVSESPLHSQGTRLCGIID